jgi:hypothetical protein
MKTAEIPWELFWQVASQQTTEGKNSWLGRWAFADDSVRLSMQPARTDTEDADLSGGGTASNNLTGRGVRRRIRSAKYRRKFESVSQSS